MSELLFEPAGRALGIIHGIAVRFIRTPDHDHRNSKPARGLDLAVGRRTPRVFWKPSPRSPPASEARPRPAHRTDRGRTTGADRVAARYRPAARSGARHSDGEDCSRRRPSSSRPILRKTVWGFGPNASAAASAVATSIHRSAGRGRQAGRRTVASGIASCRQAVDGVGRDLIGIGMRRIDHRLDAFAPEPCDKPAGAAEAASPGRHGLRPGMRGAPGQRQCDLEASVIGNRLASSEASVVPPRIRTRIEA